MRDEALDRREDVRVGITLRPISCVIYDPSHGKTFSVLGTITNLSAGGCGIRLFSDQDIAIGAHVTMELELVLPHRSVKRMRLRGEVLHSRQINNREGLPHAVLGVQFSDITPEQQRIIRQFVFFEQIKQHRQSQKK